MNKGLRSYKEIEDIMLFWHLKVFSNGLTTEKQRKQELLVYIHRFSSVCEEFNRLNFLYKGSFFRLGSEV